MPILGFPVAGKARGGPDAHVLELAEGVLLHDLPESRDKRQNAGQGTKAQNPSVRPSTIVSVSDEMRDEAASVVGDRIHVFAHSQATGGVADDPASEHGVASLEVR